MCTPRQLEQLLEKERNLKLALQVNTSVVGERPPDPLRSREAPSLSTASTQLLDNRSTQVLPEDKPPLANAVLGGGRTLCYIPGKTESEAELERYGSGTALYQLTAQPPSDCRMARRDLFPVQNRGPMMVQSQDAELVSMPFLEAVNTDAIEGVNPKLMDILHNQFACIADAFQVQRNWTTTELRLVHNQMFQVGEAMENLNRRFDQNDRRFDGVQQAVTENQQKM